MKRSLRNMKKSPAAEPSVQELVDAYSGKSEQELLGALQGMSAQERADMRAFASELAPMLTGAGKAGRRAPAARTAGRSVTHRRPVMLEDDRVVRALKGGLFAVVRPRRPHDQHRAARGRKTDGPWQRPHAIGDKMRASGKV